MTDWIAISISIVALIVSIYFSYQSTLKKKAKIHYFESWDAHLPTLLPKQAKGPLGYMILDILPHHMYIFYNIEVENRGDRASELISIKFNNLKDLNMTSEKIGIEYIGNTLQWEPLTFARPTFEDGILKLDKLPAYYQIRLYFILPLSKKKSDILQDDIPYIENIKCDSVPITRVNEPFEDGSLKRLQDRLQKQFDSQMKRLDE